MKETLLIYFLLLAVLGCGRENDSDNAAVTTLGKTVSDKSVNTEKPADEKHADHKETGQGDLLSKAQEAISRAAKDGKFLVIYFFEGERTLQSISRIMEKAEQRWMGKANFITVKVSNPEEQEIVRKCGVSKVPYTTVIAPNEAITARFPGVATLDKLEKGFVSPKMAEMLKAMQNENVVFLCLVGENTKYGSEVIRSAEEAVRKLSGIAALIHVDPKDKQEESLLKQIKVAPDITVAATVVVAPTGIIVERFIGRITSRDLFDSFEKIMTMGSGCGASTATGGSACDPSAGVGGGSQACE